MNEEKKITNRNMHENFCNVQKDKCDRAHHIINVAFYVSSHVHGVLGENDNNDNDNDNDNDDDDDMLTVFFMR